MFSIESLTEYLENEVTYNYFVNDFPSNSPDSSAFLRFEGGFTPSKWTSFKRPSFQAIVRGGKNEGKETEQKANEIYQFFHQRKEFEIEGYRIVICLADQSIPFPIGTDENHRPLYSVNFTLTLI
ncbi:minor capsid protein [Chengkuizengella axinellae]|uniref:Minor capsid protein n=1 Tax=Chengkuizengella axinellae TaxID=3064388 RepID=A0ABT9IYZ9_9BACL|nr:minor capsid protein [Chengkuizengella sp. 2205SS18-9]MDP5274352.1 minor capsid protein [Chengkuizengella sp. 2205SS18-9]